MPYEYIHRPRKANSIQKFKGKKIHVKPGKYILRGEPCIHYLDEFSHHIVWGNTVKLYNHNVRTLRKIIRSTTTPDNYYVCHMKHLQHKAKECTLAFLFLRVPFSHTWMLTMVNCQSLLETELPLSRPALSRVLTKGPPSLKLERLLPSGTHERRESICFRLQMH